MKYRRLLWIIKQKFAHTAEKKLKAMLLNANIAIHPLNQKRPYTKVLVHIAKR
jgi:hypothetical protein